jgi:hypothetical protein
MASFEKTAPAGDIAAAPAPMQQSAPAQEAQPPADAPAPERPSTPANAPAQDFLIYEATLSIAVYQVEKGMTDLLALARELQGQVVERGDDRIVFRVPRVRFDEALARADHVGDVLHRDVHAEDVGDQVRDLDVRLKNARAMRDRLEQLLARAANVKDSLEIESELSRTTEEIERLSGQLQLLGHRIAYSKITVSFQARHTENLNGKLVKLPFPWLETLGLGTLLDLRE